MGEARRQLLNLGARRPQDAHKGQCYGALWDGSMAHSKIKPVQRDLVRMRAGPYTVGVTDAQGRWLAQRRVDSLLFCSPTAQEGQCAAT